LDGTRAPGRESQRDRINVDGLAAGEKRAEFCELYDDLKVGAISPGKLDNTKRHSHVNCLFSF
jgi:hypothetical protein